MHTMRAKINIERCRAKCANGAFRPLEEVQIKEGTVAEVHVPPENQPAAQRRSIKDLTFYGMWADRDDINYHGRRELCELVAEQSSRVA